MIFDASRQSLQNLPRFDEMPFIECIISGHGDLSKLKEQWCQLVQVMPVRIQITNPETYKWGNFGVHQKQYSQKRTNLGTLNSAMNELGDYMKNKQ
jgi:hypothetical protein